MRIGLFEFVCAQNNSLYPPDRARLLRAPPAVVVRELNEYLTEMVAVIQKYKGMVDKFLGDGNMAILGTPVEDPDAALEEMEHG